MTDTAGDPGLEDPATRFGQWSAKPQASPIPVGLAAQLTTMLIYSGCVTPFQRLSMLPTIIESYAIFSLSAACAVGLICFILVLRGKTLPGKGLSVAAVILYALGNGGFLYLMLATDAQLSIILTSAVATGAGNALIIVAWGRILRSLDLRNAVLDVGIAGLVSAALEAALLVLPTALELGLFALCMLTVIVYVLMASGDIPDEPAESISGRRVIETIRAFGSVTVMPMIGLAIFAFSMALMRGDFTEVFSAYLVAAFIASLLFVLLAFVRFDRSASGFIFQLLLPGLALLVLAANNILWIIGAQTSYSGLFNYLLYISVAIVSIATCAAIAHSAEFSSDLVFSALGTLFTLFSIIGQLIAESGISSESVTIVLTVLIVVYALTMVILPNILRWADMRTEDRGTPQETGAAPQSYEERISVVCADVAKEYRLTSREVEILQYLARGHNSTYISNALFISNNTTRTHIRNIYAKIGCSSREELLALISEVLR